MREWRPMTLTLSMLRCPDAVPPQTRTVAGGEFSIGRGSENDWVLPDPERVLSKCHCILAYRSGAWQIADLSTNGTFINRDNDPIGRGQAHDVRDGDRLRLGAYEIELRITEAAMPARAAPAAAVNPFATDPFETPAKRLDANLPPDDLALRGNFSSDPFSPGTSSDSVNLPADYDPLAPDPVDQHFAGPTQADHSPHIEDAFAAPLARTVLPDDWDRETNPRASAAAPAEIAAPAPVSPAAPPPAATPPPAAAPTQVAAADELLAAFLRGADVRDAKPADPVAAMEALGVAFRALVSGLRQTMIARSAIKSEFRIEQTLIRSRGNNPLKFSADDDDALIALIGAGRRTEMNAADAVSDALRDMRLHEIATFAAMQTAVRALLSELDPVKMSQAADRGALNFVAIQRKAHAWDEFIALYGRISRALEDDFDSIFGKAFARAYERALADASAREGP
jgi:type VI secretion system FHA domain protein